MHPRTLITFLLFILIKLGTEGIGVLPLGGEKCAQPHDQPIGLLGCIARQQPSYPLGEELRRHTPSAVTLAWPELAGPVLSDEISIGHTHVSPSGPLIYAVYLCAHSPTGRSSVRWETRPGSVRKGDLFWAAFSGDRQRTSACLSLGLHACRSAKHTAPRCPELP